MSILIRMWKIFCKIWSSGEAMPNRIDYHKWESKVEIFRSLSSRRQ